MQELLSANQTSFDILVQNSNALFTLADLPNVGPAPLPEAWMPRPAMVPTYEVTNAGNLSDRNWDAIAAILAIGNAVDVASAIKELPLAPVVVLAISERLRSPAVVPYVLTKENRDANGCFMVKGYRAVWPSGAQAASPDIIRLCGSGPIWEWKFDRPDGVPNLAADLAVHNQIVALQHQNAEMAKALISGLAQGMVGSRRYYVPRPIQDSARSGGDSSGGDSLPQLAPDGSFVTGGRPVTLCPNGQYVAGNCVLTPNGTFVGQ